MDEEIYRLSIGEGEILIRPYKDTDDVSEITRLLHSSYKVLADMGFRYMATHQDDNETLKRLTTGFSYLGFSDDRIISTITLYESNKETHGAEWYTEPGVMHFGQFAVSKEFQNKGVGNFMMDIIEDKALKLGAKELALDTSEGAVHLIDFYRKRNYRFIQYVNWEVTNYRSVIMSKKLFN